MVVKKDWNLKKASRHRRVAGDFFPVALETITDPSKSATNPNG